MGKDWELDAIAWSTIQKVLLDNGVREATKRRKIIAEMVNALDKEEYGIVHESEMDCG